jgi:serine/threonine protein kinase
MTTFTCPQGHEWQEKKDDKGTDRPPRCPVCATASELVDQTTVLRDTKTEIPDAGTATPVPLHGPAIQGYEILGVLGQGGMGIVYRARQVSLKRMVGLKMLQSAAADSSSLARFRAEAEAVAQLQHPNIVQIYEIGEHQGRPFFAMELVEGVSLAQALNRNLFPLRETATLVATLAQAIQFAHEHGIVHRDLKPGNILLQIANSTSHTDNNHRVPKQSAGSNLSPASISLSSAIPKITDFGVAKRLDAEGPTLTGAILGTPSYMPPEQATGDIAAIGPATDTYALGAILYEMLAGQPPFQTHTASMTLWKVVHEEAARPSKLRPHLPRDLETICLTCLDKDPRRRYASARLLADDLHAYLAGLPIQASPAGAWRRLLGWLRAHPAVALLGGVGGLAILGGLVGLWFQSPWAVAGLTALSLCLGAWWYNARLERALFEVGQQNVFAQRSVQRMHLLLDTVHRLLAAPNLDQRLRILGEAAALLVNAERATIFLIDEARGELWSKLALGEEAHEIRMPMGSGIAGSVLQTGQVINLSDPYNDPRFNPEIDRRTGFTTRNLLTLPMADGAGRRLGVFQVLNKRGGSFGSEDVEILAQLARSASQVVV